MQPLTGTGIWAFQLRYGDAGAIREMAIELEELGYSALWIPDVGGDLFSAVEVLMGATQRTTIATGILNLWMHTPEETAQQHARLTAAHGDRFLVGIGVSHQHLIDRTEAGRYNKPLSAMRSYLDGLDATEHPLPRERRVLAALGPKMLQLARDRSAGAHPYNVTPEHTAIAREAVGPDALVATEQAVALTTDPVVARAAGRQHASIYLNCRTTRTTCVALASPTRTSPMAGATGSSMPSWRGVTRPRSRRGCRSTATPAPTTCASRSSTSTTLRRRRSGALSRRRSSSS